MSDKNMEAKGNSQSTAGFTFEDAWSAPEKELVRKEQITMQAAPGREAPLSFPQSTTCDWTIRRGKSGAIAHLKEGANAPVTVRKDNLGDDVTGYSFSRQINNAIIEERMVVRDLGNGRFTGLEDTTVYNPSETQPRMYVREAIAGSTDTSVMTNIDMKRFASQQSNEQKWLTDKMALLNSKLGPVGTAHIGQVCVDATLETGAQSYYGAGIAPGSYYTNLAGNYVKPVHVPVEKEQYNGYSANRPQDVPVSQEQYNGYSNARPGDVPVQNQQYNGYSNGRPSDVPVQNQQYNGYREGAPVNVPVAHPIRDRIINNIVGGYRGTAPSGTWNQYIKVPVSVGRLLTPGGTPPSGTWNQYNHSPCSSTMPDGSSFQKPKRPLRVQEPVIDEAPPRFVPPPATPKPVFVPTERKPVATPASGEGESGNVTKTDLYGQVLPYKKPGEQ